MRNKEESNRDLQTKLPFYLIVIILTILFAGVTCKTVSAATGVTASDYGNLVIFVQFADTEENFMGNQKDVDTIVKNYTDPTFSKSLVSYIHTISYGKMNIHPYMPQYHAKEDTITPVTLSKKREEYASDYSAANITKEALDTLVKNGTNLSKTKLDYDGDGIIDNVTLICEGKETDRSSVFFSHKEDYPGSETYQGLLVRTVNVLNSATLLDSANNSYGVISHEYMHSLGYPDLYTEEGSAQPVERWDLMARSSNFMQYPLSFLRSAISGWLDTTTITPEDGEQTLTLSPASSNSGKRSYIIKSPLSSTEFFVLEYRKQGTLYTDELDVKIPGTGLIAYRINTKQADFSNHHGLPYGVYVYRPGETDVNAATKENLNQSFFSKEAGRTKIGTTDLNATIKDDALVFSDGTNSGIEISDIGSAGDTISCNVRFADYDKNNMWSTLLDGNEQGINTDTISIDRDDQGGIYVAYSRDFSVQVKKYQDGAWQSVGSGISGFGGNMTLKIYQNKPYVLFSDGSDDFNMVLYTLESGTWKCVMKKQGQNTDGNVSIFDKNYIQYHTMEVGADGLEILYGEGKPEAYQLHLDVYDGTKVSTKVECVTKGNIANPKMATDGENTYIICQNMDSKSSDLYCVKGSTTTKIDTSLEGKKISATQPSKIAANNGRLYVLEDCDDGLKVYVYQGTTWKYLKSSATPNGALTTKYSPTSDITMMGDVPVIQLVHQQDDQRNTQVYRYRNGNWTQEGNTIDSGMSNEAQLCVFESKIYLAYVSGSSANSVAMIKYKELQLTNADIPETQKPETQKPETQKPETQKPEVQKPTTEVVTTTTENKVTTTESSSTKPRELVVKEIKLSNTKYTYKKGKNYRPTVVLKDDKNRRIGSSNYRVQYPKKCENVGIYTVTIIMNDTQKKYTKNYQVNPKGTKIKKAKKGKTKLSVTWKKQKSQTSGYQIKYSVKKNMKRSKIKTIKKNKITKITIKKLKKNKKYYVRIRTYKTVTYKGRRVKLYSKWSK